MLFICVCLLLSVDSFSQERKNNRINVQQIELLRVKAGSGPDTIGIISPPEANPEGPMSFTVGADETIYILDQVNSRIQLFKKGKRIKTIPIPEKNFIDMDIAPQGTIVLLDNLVKKSVFLMDSNGTMMRTIPLEGKNIPNAAGVLHIHIIDDGELAGIWVSVGDKQLRSVRIASLNGIPDHNRLSVPGVLSHDGKRLLNAHISGDATVEVYVSQKEKFSLWDERSILLNAYVVEISGIWIDNQKRTYLSLSLEEASRTLSRIVLICNAQLQEIGRIHLPTQQLPHEIWRSLRISPEGHIYHMFIHRKDVVIKKYEPIYSK